MHTSWLEEIFPKSPNLALLTIRDFFLMLSWEECGHDIIVFRERDEIETGRADRNRHCMMTIELHSLPSDTTKTDWELYTWFRIYLIIMCLCIVEEGTTTNIFASCEYLSSQRYAHITKSSQDDMRRRVLMRILKEISAPSPLSSSFPTQPDIEAISFSRQRISVNTEPRRSRSSYT
jgi:hypothetical protein